MRAQTKRIDQLDTKTKAAMLGLLDQHFEGVTASIFDADLADKTHAVLLLDIADQLVGFSTIAVYTAPGPDNHPATIVCSGDTIVAAQARGSSMLPSAWVQAVHNLHDQTDHEELYWLLITSGYRTYRFLPVFVRAYCPAAEQGQSSQLLHCMDRLATQRWAKQYNPRTGIVRLTNAQPLKPQLSIIPPSRRSDPHIAYFLNRNPGHARGDELVSLACLNVSNLSRAGLRMLSAKPAAAGNGGARP